MTTDGEFHSMRRQLTRLQEAGLQVSVVPVQPLATLSQRMIGQLRPNTIAAMASLVMFQDSSIFHDIVKLIEEADQRSIPTLVDTYHAVNVFPVDVKGTALCKAFVLGGGYKYLQAGEGNCFMALPESHNGWLPRPIITGWFAEFAELQNSGGGVAYGRGHAAFAGSTYDPTSHYRANEVFRFFRQQQLTPSRLRTISQTQIAWLYDGLKELNLDWRLLELPRTYEFEQRGGFLAIRSSCAEQWVERLRVEQVYCDSRNGFLRLGPAPYVSKKQIMRAIEVFARLGKAM